VTLSARDLADRVTTLEAVIARTGATEIHPYDHPHVIAGAGTAALELMDQAPGLDAVIAPVGGGGLLSGTTIAVHGADPSVAVFGAEPAGADDAERSLAIGSVQPSIDPHTLCDGLMTSLSERTFAIISGAGPVQGVDGIATADDAGVVTAMRMLIERAKLVVEPSGAIGVAAARRLVADGSLAPTDSVGVIISGGNLNLDHLPF
jgi:threonine dehydratase